MIPELQLAQARTGEATASLWSGPEKVYAARLRELSPSADGRHTFRCRPGESPHPWRCCVQCR